MSKIVPLEKVREEIISILAQIGVTPENRPDFYIRLDRCERSILEKYGSITEPQNKK